MDTFKGSFTQQEPIPEAGIDAAMAVLRQASAPRPTVASGQTDTVWTVGSSSRSTGR